MRQTKKLRLESLEPRLMLSRATPTLALAATVGTGQRALASSPVAGAAVILSGGDRPYGRIEFKLLAPGGNAIHTEWVRVHGDSTYHTSSIVIARQSGSYTWHAIYFGDLRNNPASDRSHLTGTAIAQAAPSPPQPATLPPPASALPQLAPSSATPTATTPSSAMSPPVVINKPAGYETFYQTAASDKTEPSKQAYYRYDWAQIEPTYGVYDFSAIQRDYTAAQAAGQQFNFRIMPYEDGGGGPVALQKAGLSGSTFKFNGATTFQPNLGNAAVQADLDKLLGALGARFGGATATIDVGWWGSYGEWSNYGTSPALVRPSTAATEWLISETKKYFPRSYTIVQASIAVDDPTAFAYAMAAGCGVRYDGWGDWSINGQWSGQDNLYPAVIAATGDQWKRAPIILEPWGTFSSWIGTEPWQKSFDWAINTAHAWMFSDKSSGPIPTVMQTSVNQLLAAEIPPALTSTVVASR